jgi:hypothetical protein
VAELSGIKWHYIQTEIADTLMQSAYLLVISSKKMVGEEELKR